MSAPRQNVDFDLHGIVGIRLLDAAPGDAAAVRRQLGPLETRLDRPPDIRVRFVDHLETPNLRLLGLNDAGFTDDAFLILRSRHKTPARVQIPIAQLGGPCEILCERGLPAVPLLVQIVNVTALVNGALPLHAAAFVYAGQGVLVTGWSKGGKTETLLGFMAAGATYVGDEWVYLLDGGTEMAGIPEPLRVWDWHLPDLPAFRLRLTLRQRARLAGLRPVAATAARLGNGNGPLSGLARRAAPLITRQQGVNAPPERLFGRDRWQATAALDRILFVMSHASPEVTIRPVDAGEVARRMAFSLQEEAQPLLEAYRKFRFAFPDVANNFLDCLPETQARALRAALTGRPAYTLLHPYPAPIERLYQVARPYVTGEEGR